MIKREQVVAGYRAVLGRDPESDEVIALQMQTHCGVEEFEATLRASLEYERHQARAAKGIGLYHLVTPANIEQFVIDSDSLGSPGSEQVEEFWAGKVYRTNVEVNESLDPFSEEYVAQQIAVYREMSGRDVNQDDNELAEFEFDRHLEAPNPYGDIPAHTVAMHMSRIARAIERAQLSAGATVLDMGCGWGVSSELMSFAGLKVTALDINPRFVDLVNARARRINHGTIAVRGSFDSIPGGELFDAVLFYESLHHAVRPWATLRSVYDRLRPGGKLLLAGEPFNDMWKHWGLRTDPMSTYCIRKFGWFESGWSVAFLRASLEQCGFQIDHFAEEGGTVGWVVVATRPEVDAS